MGLINFFNKKQPDQTDKLELMRYHIVQAQNDIKKLQKQHSKLVDWPILLGVGAVIQGKNNIFLMSKQTNTKMIYVLLREICWKN